MPGRDGGLARLTAPCPGPLGLTMRGDCNTHTCLDQALYLNSKARQQALHLDQTGHPTGLSSLQKHLTSLNLPSTSISDLASLTPDSTCSATQERWATQWQAEMASASTKTTSQHSHYLNLVSSFPDTCQAYLSDPQIPPTHLSTLARFRCGTHWLASHTSRYQKAKERQRIHHISCQKCNTHTWSAPNYFLLCDSCDA